MAVIYTTGGSGDAAGQGGNVRVKAGNNITFTEAQTDNKRALVDAAGGRECSTHPAKVAT
ncbi:MAG: hypothetical protein R2857_05060 [Vampirovibrionales bacterium]